MATQVLSAATTTDLLPSGAPDYYSNSMSDSSQRQSRILDMPRSHFNAAAAASGYRGTAAAPVSTYAFKSTPQLRTDTRSVSSPAMSASQPSTNGSTRNRYPANPSVSTTSSTSSDPSSISQHHLFNKEDALLFTNFSVPPFSAETDAQSVPNVHIANGGGYNRNNQTPPKPSPDRYRHPLSRTGSDLPAVTRQQSEDSIRTVGTATTGHIYQKPQIVSTGMQRSVEEDRQASAGQTDMQYANTGKQSPTSELPKRYRRRTEGGPVDAVVKPSSTFSPPSTVAPSMPNSAPSQSSVSRHASVTKQTQTHLALCNSY